MLYGGGFYTATEKATSSGYTSSEGTVLELPVNLTAGLRVLDLQKYQNKHPIDFMKHTLEAKRQEKDINLYLAEKFNLDIIVNGYPLVMNPKAVQFPKQAKDLVKAFFSEGVPEVLLKHSYKEIVSFIDLGAAMGVSGLPDLKQIGACLKDSDPKVRQAAIQVLGQIKNLAPGVLEPIAACLKDSDYYVRRITIRVLGNCKVQDQEILDKIAMCFLERNDFWEIDKVWEELTGVDTTKDRTDFRRLAIGVSAALREGTRAIGSLWKR